MLSFIISLLCFLGESATSQDLTRPIVDLGYSQYNGIRLSAGVDQYLGMRYASPPVGDLRFRAPADPVNCSSVQTAFEVRIARRLLGVHDLR